MLLRFNLIKSFELGNHTIFIPVEDDEKIAKIYYLARNIVRNKILRHLIENERTTRPEIPKEIQESRENVYYHIKILIEHNCIVSLNKDIFLNPKFKQQIIEAIQNLSQNQELNYIVK